MGSGKSVSGEDSQISDFIQQGLAHGYGIPPVNTQNLDCGPANGGSPNQNGTIPSETVMPSILPGMKQSRYSSRPWIDASQIRAFEGITEEARECQVVRGCGATVLFRDDMVNLEGNAGEFAEKPQYSQQLRARRQTCASRRASMRFNPERLNV